MPRTNVNKNFTSAWASLLVLIALSFGEARAGGATLFDYGTPDSGHAIAGRFAIASNACTAIDNPAGMTRLSGRQMVFGGMPLLSSAEFEVGADTDTTGGDGGDAGGVTPVAAFCYARSIAGNDDLWFGFGVGGLAGGAYDFDEGWVGRYYLTELEFSAVAAAGSVGYRVNDKLSIGGGLIVANGVLEQKAAINNVLDSVPDGRLEVDDTVFALAVGAGVLVEPTEHTRFGLAYVAELDLEFEDTLTTTGVGPGLQALLDAAGLSGSRLDIGLTLPQKAFASWYHEFSDRLALMGNLGWEDYSEFGFVDVSIVNDTTVDLTADLAFKDTRHVALGARLGIDERSTFTTGISYDTSPVSAADRSPVLPLDRQARVSFGFERTRHSGNDWAVSLFYLDLGSASFDVERGPLAGRVQGEFDTYAVLGVGFSWLWR